MKYMMKCSCGDEMTVDAMDKNEAVEKLKIMMNKEAVEKHFQDKHKGQQAPPLEQVHMMIAQQVMPA